jgi:hypothetical protein
MKRWTSVILILAAWGAAAAAPVSFALRGSVLGNGGAPSSGGTIHLQGTMGQPAVGLSDGAAFMVCSGFWCAGGVRVVAVEPDPVADTPKRLFFGAPYPNPARGRVSFALELPKRAGVSLDVYDARGRRVTTLAQGPMDPGKYSVSWDGKSSAQEFSGIYFAVLVIDGQTVARQRVVLLR